MRLAMLSGGVGGARMARGFETVGEAETTVVVNVADDDTIYGLHVSPDLDTVCYTLAGVEGEQGWGRSGETWNVMEALAAFPVDSTFRLGDRDLATNLYRTARLGRGDRLSEVTASIADTFGLRTRVLPATDDRLRTMVMTGDGEWLDFQTYFVFRHHTDPVSAVRFDGIESAAPAPGVLEAIAEADAVVLGPSNPILSIWPIIRVPGVREAVAANGRVLAVSPLIGGAALKGPAVEVLSGLGFPPGLPGVPAAYDGLLTDLVVDDADAGSVGELEGVRIHVSDTRIAAPAAAERLAKEIITWLA